MMANGKTYTRICVDCGKVMHNVHRAKMRCPECAQKRHAYLTAQWLARKNAEIRSTRPKPKEPVKTAEERDIEFRADCRAADKAGLSYGQWRARQSKRPIRVTSTDGPKG